MSQAPATAQDTTNGCSASSSSSGSYLVTAVVTKGSETFTVSASLTVPAVVTTAARVTIAAINQGGASAPIGNIQGQVDVALNIERGTEILERVDLLVDNTAVASQTLGVATAAEGDGPDAQAIQRITLSFDSGCYSSGEAGAACGTVDEEAGVAFVRHANGSHTVSAQLVSGGETSLRASNTVTLVFNNTGGFHVLADLPRKANGTVASFTDENGLIWYGGSNTSEFGITAIPIQFGAGTVTSVTVDFLDCGTDTNVGAPFIFEFDCEGEEGATMSRTPTSASVIPVGGTALPDEVRIACVTASAAMPAARATDAPFQPWWYDRTKAGAIGRIQRRSPASPATRSGTTADPTTGTTKAMSESRRATREVAASGPFSRLRIDARRPIADAVSTSTIVRPHLAAKYGWAEFPCYSQHIRPPKGNSADGVTQPEHTGPQKAGVRLT